MPDALNYRVGPHPGWPFKVPDAWNNKEGPQAGKPSKLPEQVELRRKTGQRGLLIASYKRLTKRF